VNESPPAGDLVRQVEPGRAGPGDALLLERLDRHAGIGGDPEIY